MIKISLKNLKVKGTSDSFLNNFAYMLISMISAAIIGLIFWMIAGQMYPIEDVGVATALISIAGLLVSLSRVGFDQTLPRFFPEGNRSSIYSTAIFITTAIVVIVCTFFLLTAGFYMNSLNMNAWEGIFFVLFVGLFSISLTTNCAYNSIRGAKYGLIQNLVMGSRIFILIPFIALGYLGIMYSFIIAYALSFIISIFILRKYSIHFSRPDFKFIKQSFNYSIGNYVSGIIISLPTYILPILIISILGASETATYYMAYSFSAIILNIPLISGSLLLIEGSYGSNIKKVSSKALLVSYAIIIPVTAILFFSGGWLLGLIGEEYANNGLELIQMMAVSGSLITIFQIYLAVLRVNKDMRGLIAITVINCLAILGMTLYFISDYGLVGVGYSWLSGYGVSILAIIIYEIMYGHHIFNQIEQVTM